MPGRPIRGGRVDAVARCGELLAARETIVENERVAEELRHRTDNLFAVLVAIVRLSARNSQDVGELSSKIERRVEALAGAHRVSLAAEGLNHDRSNLRDLVDAVGKLGVL